VAVSLPIWVLTVVGVSVLVVVDLIVVARRYRRGEQARVGWWIAAYVGLACLFGAGLAVTAGATTAGEFIAGYTTEYSLSVDNLFVFLLILRTFRVPGQAREKALLIGIVVSLVLRGACIAAGAAAVARFSWTFYIFSALLVYSAVSLMRESSTEEMSDSVVLTALRRVVPSSPDYHADRVLTRVSGRRVVTPMFYVVVAIGIANVVFALDSLPAIFGLSRSAYVIFAANAFAVLGLRQLFFVVDGLLERLRYLNVGLCLILAFIGVKLFLEALSGSGYTSIAGVGLPHLGVATSLGTIAACLLATALASIFIPGPPGDNQPTVG
jgi:tellurite resistance protein TerC